MKIAIAGKGGTGKTFIAACLARLFAEAGRQVYAVDADPAGSFGTALGLTAEALAELRPIVDMRGFIKAGHDDDALYLSAPGAGGISGQFNVDSDGVRFLKMADAKPADGSCYCEGHDFLRALLGSMLIGNRDVVIVDMCPGIEHLARGAAKAADMLLIVAEATRACVETTKLIRSLGAELGVSRIKIVANKISSEKEELLVRASFHRDEILGVVRMSKTVADSAIGIGMAGDPATLPIPADVRALFENLRECLKITFTHYRFPGSNGRIE